MNAEGPRSCPLPATLTVLNPKPVNQNAAKILKKSTDNWTAMSRCPYCGSRCYEHGWCFGCGRAIQRGEGESLKRRTHE